MRDLVLRQLNDEVLRFEVGVASVVVAKAMLDVTVIFMAARSELRRLCSAWKTFLDD